jgi:D-glycero-D-manno-heptose 1,7-bisphosphate phosphatase
MINCAAEELGISLKESFVVGDSIKDLETAWLVRAKPVLVLTGYGKQTLSSLSPEQRGWLSYIAPNLFDACKWICEYSW